MSSQPRLTQHEGSHCRRRHLDRPFKLLEVYLYLNPMNISFNLSKSRLLIKHSLTLLHLALALRLRYPLSIAPKVVLPTSKVSIPFSQPSLQQTQSTPTLKTGSVRRLDSCGCGLWTSVNVSTITNPRRVHKS